MDPEVFNYHYCDDLPTQPLPENTRILVTGANGYVARRLIPELVHRGYFVRCVQRNRRCPPILTHPRIEVVYADCQKPDELRPAMEGMDFAYYLIHSMRFKKSEFSEMDKLAAQNFTRLAEECSLKRVIYLGGLGETGTWMSPHLKSRREVGDTLSKSKVPVIRLRAAIIIGTGSASYELLKSLVLHNRWIPFLTEFNSKCQPIAIRDVVKYLVGVLETEGLSTCIYQIGGKDVGTYKELVQKFAKILNRHVRFIDVSWVPLPISALCRMYAYWLHLFISIPVNITSLLLDSLRADVVCANNDIQKILPFEPLDFDTAVHWALEKEEKSQVYSHWSDASHPEMSNLLPICEYEAAEFNVEEHSIDIPADPDRVFRQVCRVGGDHGWVHGNFLWEVRGFIDRLLGGPGLHRGRRDQHQLRIGDAVDFWRVESLVPGRELLLRAELISPGLSWLQFELEPGPEDKTRLTIRAHFIPKPFWGEIYWVGLSRFHTYIFKGMLKYFYRESIKPENDEELYVQSDGKRIDAS